MDNEEKFYIEYEDCQKIAPKRAIAKFKKDILKSKIAPQGELNLIPVLDHVTGSYNVPRAIRTANVFGAKEVYIVGIDYFNPYPSVGAVRHTKIEMLKTAKEAINLLKEKQYTIYTFLPPKYGGTSIWNTKFNLKGSAFIVGNEVNGISFNIEDFPDIKKIYIPHRGQTESLNVSVAMSIAISEFDRQAINNQTKNN